MIPALIGLALAIALAGPIRLALRTTGRRYVIDHVPGSRVRRSGLALWRVVVGTFIPGLAAIALIEGLRGGGMLAPGWEGLAHSFQRAVFVAALITRWPVRCSSPGRARGGWSGCPTMRPRHCCRGPWRQPELCWQANC